PRLFPRLCQPDSTLTARNPDAWLRGLAHTPSHRGRLVERRSQSRAPARPVPLKTSDRATGLLLEARQVGSRDRWRTCQTTPARGEQPTVFGREVYSLTEAGTACDQESGSAHLKSELRVMKTFSVRLLPPTTSQRATSTMTSKIVRAFFKSEQDRRGIANQVWAVGLAAVLVMLING